MAMSSSQTLALQRNSCEQNRFMEKLMTKICSFYDEQSLIDVTFKVSNPTALVPAHRLILAAASPYFENLFNGNQGTNPVIEIHDIDSDIFEHLITFCYTGEALITVNNVAAMLNAAIVLQLDDAITSSVDYLITHIDEYTLQAAYALERKTKCEVLRQKIIEYETQNFMEISRSDDFLNFDVEKLQRILVSDNLNITREEDAFDAIQRWYNYDVPARQEQLPLLIACLRLTQFNVDFLVTQIQPLPGCELLAFKALSWIREPTARPMINMRFTEPRGVSTTYCDEKTILALCSKVNPKLLQYNKTEDKWEEYASIKIDYGEYRTILKDGSLLFIGGYKGVATYNVVRSWNIRNKTWQNLPGMIQARRSHCVVELDDKIYAIGGCKGGVLSSVERYTISDGWIFVTSLIYGRYDAGAVTLNGKIFIMGGNNGKGQTITVECYNPDSNTWTSCANMTEYYFSGVAAHKGHIYVLSRRNEHRSVERYDPQLNTWSQICSLEVGPGLMTCVSLDNKLWAIGGKSKSADKSCVSVFDEENFCWVERCSLPESEMYNCFVVPEFLLSSM
ncbi:kelch-like protein 17 isoform X1 [Bactrocera neohumeralis]|uniref:kelch-like protein 17 isoform X1 n=1 Tax=Bactrocera neohumeralis TaxID=98809 RepID=UPI002166B9FB|nr:kelch-like protein 17 isoform X1 [Bactrocera neohumeralis]XP_050336112.1 kelch-like protein 17 isoform X1 [Bactrocera neohumeralis]